MAGKPTLYQWGAIPFQAYPLMLMEVQHVTQTGWARKEIAGAAIYREWVGEDDEELHFRGEVYPHYFRQKMTQYGMLESLRGGYSRGQPDNWGGLGHLEVMDNMRRLGQAHPLARGDGWHMGWFVIERLQREHAHLGPEGIGKQVKFEVTFQRVPVPNDNLAYFPAFWGSISP